MRNTKTKNVSPYVHPPRTQKFEPCYCNVCKGKSIDPRTKESHSKNKIISQREITVNFPTSRDLLIDLIIPMPENLDINSNEELQEEIYPFLVKKCQRNSRKNRTTFTHPEAIHELFSDDNASEGDGEREPEDNAVDEDIYSSSSESDDDCQVDFGAPEIEIDQNNTMHYEKESNSQYSWIVIWILKYQERYHVATESLFKFFLYVLTNVNENIFSDFPTSLYMA